MNILQSILNDFIKNEVKNYEKLSKKELDDKINKLIDSIPELKDKIAAIVKQSLDKRSYFMLRDHRRVRRGFTQRHALLWGRTLELLETIIVISYESGEEINISLREEASKRNDFIFEALTRLHARAIQVAYEVLHLLRGGFADGAHARWRTIHEITVTGLFISKHGQEMAERYLLHEIVESYKAMIECQKYYKELSPGSFQDVELQTLETLKDELVKRFGKKFLGQYGWASNVINGNPKFNDIERDIGLEYLRPYYRMASHNVHANPKGIKFRLGLSDEQERILLAGPSNFGLEDPVRGATLSLFQITSSLLTHKPNLDSLVIVEILSKYEKEILNALDEVSEIMKSESIGK